MINANKPERWKSDIAQSIDFYNRWFMHYAPQTFRETRLKTTEQVLQAFQLTHNLTDLSSEMLKASPTLLAILRMATAPPIARDRLIGLAQVSGNLVSSMEQFGRIPPKLSEAEIQHDLQLILRIITQLLDQDILPWVTATSLPAPESIQRAATVIADRLCGTVADPLIRNGQEQRQLKAITDWLDSRGYKQLQSGDRVEFRQMPAGTYTFRLNLAVQQAGTNRQVKVPIDTVVAPKNLTLGELPILIEAKSAGDFTNTNKRRKEEATKMIQLRNTYGVTVRFILLLAGYFDSGYLGYEAAEGIDWVWEHRLDDLAEFGL